VTECTAGPEQAVPRLLRHMPEMRLRLSNARRVRHLCRNDVGIPSTEVSRASAPFHSIRVRCPLETVLVCNYCRAETRLDGFAAQQRDVMDFCNDHQNHTEGHGFSVLLPLAQFGIVAITSLPAGATVSQFIAGSASPIVHAALEDMSSLCRRLGAGSLLRFNGLSWGDVPTQDRCAGCNALT
jgi:hypothetical protein